MLVSRAACPLVASKAVFCERAGPPSFCRGALSSAVGAVCGEWRVLCYLSLIGFSEWPPFCYGIVVVEDHLPQYNRRHQAATGYTLLSDVRASRRVAVRMPKPSHTVR